MGFNNNEIKKGSDRLLENNWNKTSDGAFKKGSETIRISDTGKSFHSDKTGSITNWDQLNGKAGKK
jgi:hypothetical protein